MKRALLVAVTLLAMAALSCERETRRLRSAPSGEMRPSPVRESGLRPGPALPATTVRNPADLNAYDIAEGQRLYNWFNCSGCHAKGGGSIGPALMDEEWIYGSAPENIHETIVEGRPNGMPAFGGKIPDRQIWQIVAYVRSLSAQTPKPARSARDDHMQAKVGEQSTEPAHPKQVRTPQ